MIARSFRRVKAKFWKCRDWMLHHPRTGWYIAAYIALMVTFNAVLNIISLFH